MYISGLLTMLSNLLFVLLYKEQLYWNSYTQHVLQRDSSSEFSQTVASYWIAYLLTTAVGLGSAIASMYGLHKTSLQQKRDGLPNENTCPACKTVMLINFLIFCQLLLNVIALIVKLLCPHQVVLINYLAFLRVPFSNSAISALSPVIILVRSGTYNKSLRDFKKWRLSKSVSQETTVSEI